MLVSTVDRDSCRINARRMIECSAYQCVDHCLDIIRQQLQCSSDVGMFGQRWIQRKGKDMNVFPIFDTIHKCRNFNDILTWAKKHQARDGLVAEVRDDDVIPDAYP